MNIKINNFGPIKKYCFDLNKDFHLIFGQNNIGKSYAITIVYLVIKSILSYEDFVYQPVMRRRSAGFLVMETDANIQDNSNITEIVLKSLKKILNDSIISSLDNSLVATFDSLDNLQNQFTQEKLCIKLETEMITIEISVVDQHIEILQIKINANVVVRTIKQNRDFKVTGKNIVVYRIKGSSSSFQTHSSKLVMSLFSDFIGEVTNKVKSVHYLPASRSGLYQALSAFGQIIAELSKSRAFLTKKIELPGISEPLSDYFLKLSEINIGKKGIGQNKLDLIAKKIESEILKGTVDFDTKTKRIIFTPNNTNLKLDLSSTSSMVSELSPIVSYLRYVLSQQDRRPRYFSLSSVESFAKPLVIIEEPEAHLHPEIQIRIMGIFADLVANGVKMIITSHSNFIFNKANNLILENKINITNLQASIFRSNEQGSTGDKVETDILGINDENFIDVSEKLYDEKIELIQRLNDNA